MPSSSKTSTSNGASLGFDQTLFQSADKLRLMVKRILRKYVHPPDRQENATRTVLEQAELIAAVWTE